MILGLDDSFPPMGFRDENDQVVGFDIDLATEVAKRMGVELVIQPIDWGFQRARTGNRPCGLPVERAEHHGRARGGHVLCKAVHCQQADCQIVPEGSEIKTVADLKEKTGWPAKGLFRAGCAQRKPGV